MAMSNDESTSRLSAEQDFALALHSYVPQPNSSNCLSFNAGQVIKTLNKDVSGWWDGELNDGRRGWFPSNYVVECDQDGRTNESSASLEHEQGPVSAELVAPITVALSSATINPQSISLNSVSQAIALLKNAVVAERVPHFQPSTAGVISAVRVVLSETACLTRDSPIILENPNLASSRKQILSSLAALVSQARKASTPGLSTEERSHQTTTMMLMAESVWKGTQSFVKMVIGIESTPSPSPTTSSTPTSPQRYQQQPQLHQNDDRSDEIVIRSPSQLSELLTSMHDQLLSTIAAFIGHVHAHTRSSHSSSYAYLIDMTRETIERVREILVVVEAVTSYPAFLDRASELEAAREVLYIATTSLVTAARVATSSPEIESVAATTEDEEKRTLLQSATAVLRSGGDCIGAVKKCIARRSSDGDHFDSALNLILPQLVLIDSTVSIVSPEDRRPSSTSFTSPVESYTAQFSTDGSRSRAGSNTSSSNTNSTGKSSSRGSHTLSMLGRKATSLSCLRDMYEASSGGITPVEEDTAVAEVVKSEKIPYHRRPSIPEGTTIHHQDARLDIKLDSRFTGSTHSGPTSTSMIVQRSAPNFGLASAAMIASSSRPTLHSRTSSRTSSRGQAMSPTSSVAMSRNESSRTSESATSSRSAFSRTSTTDTSPRTSTSTTPDKAYNSHLSTDPDVTLLVTPSGRLDVYSSQSSTSNTTTTSNDASSVRTSRPPPARRPSGPLPQKEGTAWYLARDYDAQEIAFNGDGHVTGGTLRCLIERMTLHDTTIDLTFSNTFFLTFRMFTTPLALSEALYRRYDIVPGSDLGSEELREWNVAKVTPVRLRIYNFFKTWLESYWQADTDSIVIDPLIVFCRTRIAGTMSSASQRLIDLAQKRIRVTVTIGTSEKMKAGKVVDLGDPYLPLRRIGPPPPSPAISKTLLGQLRTQPASSINILDLDPLELARQFTIMESRLYCAIKADELLGQDFSSSNRSTCVNVKAMSSLSTRITGWISETILNEQDAKKRSGLVKYFIKLSERCFALDNYNTLLAILCALNSSTISRLKKTWDGLSAKYRISLDVLRKATEHLRNYAEYRARIRDASPPCLPFLGLFLTDVTFCYEGNPAERASPLDAGLRLINFDRYQKMARIVSELQRFQIPYNLIEVHELQSYLSTSLNGLAHGGDGSSLYRQSLVVEPRSTLSPSDTRFQSGFENGNSGGGLFNWKS